MRARTYSSLYALALFGMVCAASEPATAQTTVPEQAPAAAADAPPASEPAPATATKPASELPQVEVVQPKAEPEPETAVKPKVSKAPPQTVKARPVVQKSKPKPKPAPEPVEAYSEPSPAPIAPSAPEILSPDAIESAASNTGQQTNSAAGPYNAIKSYAAEGSGFGTKTGTPLKETPQSISVVGKEQIRDQGAQSVQDALRYVPGVLADGFGYDSRGDYSIIRGVPAAYYIDGLRTSYGYYVNTSSIEPYALDRVEVLRGPASMLYGQAPTGGIVNGSSKLPVDVSYNEIGVDYGSFDYKQVRFDSTGKISSDGKWLYRVTGLVRDADTYVDYVDNDRVMIQPSITYRPTSDTSITLLGNIRRDRSGSSQQFLPQIGTLTPNVNGQIVPRNTFVGEPDDYYDTDQESASLYVDHRFSEDLKLRHASRYTDTSNAYKSTYAAIMTPARQAYLNSALGGILDGSNAPFLNASQSEIARAALLQQTDTHIFNTDTNLTGTFSTGFIHHKVTGGFDYMRFAADQETAPLAVDNLLTSSAVYPAGQAYLNFIGVGLQPAFDIFNPQYGRSTYYLSLGGTSPFITPDQLATVPRPHEVQSQAGLYLQDQLRAGPWIAVLGLRQDWLKIAEKGSPDDHEEATTGRAALMYETDFGVTPYVSYSTSFNPLPGQPVASDIFAGVTALSAAKPMEGKQIEVGLKYQPTGVPVMINASIYQLTEENQIVQPDILFQAVQGADIKVRGFEVEAIGAITPELKVVASYSYTNGEWEKYPEVFPFASGISAFMVGKAIDGFPKHMASLWGVYTFQSGDLRGLSLGAGVRYVGEADSYGLDVSNLSAMHVRTPSYTLFDAMIAYETPEWRWQLTGQNLEDEYYVTSCTAFRGDCGVGQGRTWLTGFTYKF